MATTMYRKTTCKGCGYVQETTLSYYLDAKLWKTNHTLTACRERKMSQAYARLDLQNQGLVRNKGCVYLPKALRPF